MNDKERILVNLLHYQAENYLQQICNTYCYCEKCPYRMKRGSTVFLDDGTSYTTGCAKKVVAEGIRT